MDRRSFFTKFMSGISASAPETQTNTIAAFVPHPEVKPIFLTMDDGFHHLPDVLADIRTTQIPLSLFPTGEALSLHKASWKLLFEEGVDFGCHSYSHRQTSTVSFDSFRRDIDKFMDVAANVIGVEGARNIKFYRFPFGDAGGHRKDEFRRIIAEEYGWRIAGWDVSLADTFPLGAATFESQAAYGKHFASLVKPGDIVLLHFKKPDAFCLPKLLETADALGYQFMPISAYPDGTMGIPGTR